MEVKSTEVVTLADLASHLGWPISFARAQAERHGDLLEDALGRPAVSAKVARKVVDERRAETEARERDQAEYQVWSRERAAKRREVVEKARRKALDAALESQRAYAAQVNAGEGGRGYASGSFPTLGGGDPQARSAGRDAAQEAGRKFDAKHPELGFEEWRSAKR